MYNIILLIISIFIVVIMIIITSSNSYLRFSCDKRISTEDKLAYSIEVCCSYINLDQCFIICL